ncbi:MAG: outer membrane protein [Verrucomicrobiales bacterium]
MLANIEHCLTVGIQDSRICYFLLMKFISRTIISLGLTFLMLAGATAQNVKIGVVDMKRIFAEYGRTKEAESEINDRKAQAKKELDERTAKYKELLEKFQALQAQVQDEALSPQLREQKRDEGRDIGQQAKSLERQIQEFRTRRERQLQEQVVRMRKTILEEIRELVEEMSKTQNFDMVFDKSGVSLNGVPFLLHSRDAVDFSEDIINRLNAADKGSEKSGNN